MAWTDKRVERLKAMHAEGLSFSMIAARLGGVSRSAVGGMVWRLGLSECQEAGPLKIKTRRRTVFAKRAPVTLPPAPQELPPAPMPPVPALAVVEEIPVPQSERITLLALRDGMCRWPLGTPGEEDFCFCGCGTSKSAKGIFATYCEHHTRIAYARRPASSRTPVPVPPALEAA
jgi:GcrA cell cycle regulator